MVMLDWQMFVLQRRINRPPVNVIRTITNPAVFGAGSVLSCDRNGALQLDEPFRRIDAYAEPVWRAEGRLLGPRRRIANPSRWSGPRMRRYFAHAHRRADDLTHLLLSTTPADETGRRPTIQVGGESRRSC